MRVTLSLSFGLLGWGSLGGLLNRPPSAPRLEVVLSRSNVSQTSGISVRIFCDLCSGRRRPICRRLINVPSVPAPLVEYDRESSPDGASNELRIIGSASPSRDGRDSSTLRGLPDSLAEEPLPVSNVPRPRTAHFPTGDMLEELREEPTTNPLIITSLSLKGLADSGSLSRPGSAVSSRARPSSGGYISQFAAKGPNPRQTAPKPDSLNDGRTGEGSAFRRLRPATANSVRPKTTGHTDRMQSRSVGRLERWAAIIARIEAPPKAAQCGPPHEANPSCRWVIGDKSVVSAVAEDMDLTELDRHFGIIADDDGEELHAPD